jgi:hypothetical protein
MTNSSLVRTVERKATAVSQMLELLSGEAGERPATMSEVEWAQLKAESSQVLTAVDVLTRQAMKGRVDGQALAVLLNRTRLLGLAALPYIQRAGLTKALYGDDAPGDKDLIKFYLRGYGVIQDSKPVNEEERAALNDEIVAISNKDPEAVRREVLDQLRRTNEGE